ncbi:MAG: hypothetical protein ABGW63_02470 [Flavobacteriaceae bacterium]
MKKLFFLLILFVFGCTKADLQPSENIDSQSDVKEYLLNVTGCPNASGCNGWVGISFPGLKQQSIQGREAISASLPAETDVTISATPADGYYFDKWSNGWTGNPVTFTLNSDIDVTAVFKTD